MYAFQRSRHIHAAKAPTAPLSRREACLASSSPSSSRPFLHPTVFVSRCCLFSRGSITSAPTRFSIFFGSLFLSLLLSLSFSLPSHFLLILNESLISLKLSVSQRVTSSQTLACKKSLYFLPHAAHTISFVIRCPPFPFTLHFSFFFFVHLIYTLFGLLTIPFTDLHILEKIRFIGKLIDCSRPLVSRWFFRTFGTFHRLYNTRLTPKTATTLMIIRDPMKNEEEDTKWQIHLRPERFIHAWISSPRGLFRGLHMRYKIDSGCPSGVCTLALILVLNPSLVPSSRSHSTETTTPFFRESFIYEHVEQWEGDLFQTPADSKSRGCLQSCRIFWRRFAAPVQTFVS